MQSCFVAARLGGRRSQFVDAPPGARGWLHSHQSATAAWLRAKAAGAKPAAHGPPAAPPALPVAWAQESLLTWMADALEAVKALGSKADGVELQWLLDQVLHMAGQYPGPTTWGGPGPHKNPSGALLPNRAKQSRLFPDTLRHQSSLALSPQTAREITDMLESQVHRTDPSQWFEHWSVICHRLGKMPSLGDLGRLVDANLADIHAGALGAAPPQVVFANTDLAPFELHDFHVVLFGCRANSRYFFKAPLLGWGYDGEGGAWSDTTRDHSTAYKNKWVLLQELDRIAQHCTPQATARFDSHNDQVWQLVSQQLQAGADEQSLFLGGLQRMAEAGMLADVRVREQARPWIQRIFQTPAHGESRGAAVQGLVKVLRNGPGPSTLDARAVWADLALNQVLFDHLRQSGILAQYQRAQVNPQTVFDFGQLHEHYLRLLESGELVTLQEVKAVLETHRVAYAHVAPMAT
jgi:hypothetical protein